MTNIQRWGGYAGFVTGALFVAILVIQFTVLAQLGLGPNNTAAAGLAAAAKALLAYQLLFLFDVGFGVTVVLGALALRERLGAGAPTRMRLAVIAASISSALFFATGIIAFNALPRIIAANDASAYGAVNAVTGGLELAAVFSFGWAAMMQGWAGLTTKGLPAALCYVLMLGGLAALLAFAIPILGLLGVLINLIWAFWLGYVLLSRPAVVGVPMKPAM